MKTKMKLFFCGALALCLTILPRADAANAGATLSTNSTDAMAALFGNPAIAK